MRKIFAALLITSLVAPSVYGQANSAPPPRPLPPRTAAEKVEKPAQSRNFFQRLFGPRATPTPAPAPAPVVKRTPRPKPKPTQDTPSEPVKKMTPKIPPAGTLPGVSATVKPKTGKGSAKKGTPATAAMNAGDDATKFRAAKAHAMEDAHIKDLKSKADGEVNEAEAHKALLNYNRALFQKIREVDPSVSDYSGKVEQSMTKRIGNEKAKE